MKKGFSGLPSSRKAFVIMLFVFMTFYCVGLLGLYVWGFLTSLKTNAEFRVNMFGIPSGWPWNWAWENYKKAFELLSVKITDADGQRNVFMVEMFFNSFFYSASGALITTFTTWVCAYLIAKFPYKFSKLIFKINIILMFIPIVGSLPSALQIFKGIGLYDNWWYVIINSIGFVGMNLLIFHSFQMGIGNEYTEAAKIDGAGNNAIMLRIIFPLSSQMFFAIALMSFIGRWNDYMTMIVWMPNHPTLAYGIYVYSIQTTTAASWPPVQIAGCMLLFVPILLLFLIFQNTIVDNIRIGGLKG